MSVDLREALYKISLNYVKKEPYTGSFGDPFVSTRTKRKKDPLLIIPWIRPGWMRP